VFDVVACGFAAAPLASLPAAAGVLTSPAPDAPDFLDHTLDLLLPRLKDEPSRTVLLVHDGRGIAPHELAKLRAMLASSRILPVACRLPVTARAVMVSWLATFAAVEVSPGAVLAGQPWVEGLLTVRATTTTVARLDIPQVKVRHHLLSWIPGVRIPVRLGHDPLVGGAAADLPHDVPQECDVVVTGRAELARTVAQAPPSVREQLVLDAFEEGARWWGTSRWYEECLVPADIDAVVAWLTQQQWRRCPQCSDPMSDSCPFCCALEVHA